MSIDRRTWLAGHAGLAGWLAAAGFPAGLPLPAHAQGSRTLNLVVFPEPNAVMIAAASTGPAQMVAGGIYESLLRYDDRLQPMPSLATEWSVSRDGLVYMFRLKRNVTWHDAKPFTADDVVFSADKLMRTYNPRFRVGLQSVASIKALDTHTVEFRLNYPYAPFLGLFDISSCSIGPKHLLENIDFSRPPTGTPVGTGPFKFKEWVRGSHIQLVRNDAYHEPGFPKIDSVFWHVIPDGAARAAAFESGKVDVLPGGTVEYFDVPRLAKLPGAALTQKGFEKFAPLAHVWINHRVPLLQNLKVRQALALSVDREALARVVWQGFATPAYGPFHRQTPFADPKLPRTARDLKKAKALLAEAGYKGEPVRLQNLPFGETWARMGEMLKQQLAEGGFTIALQSSDLATTMARQSNWDFDLAFTFLYQSGDPALGVARSYIGSEIRKGSPFNNVGGYQNAKVDANFERGSREMDPKKRAELYAQVQRTMVEDVAALWLLDLDFPTVYRASKVDNLVNSGVGLNDGLGRAVVKV
jgi:peptide/nickel transport system substrate-binding protein